MYIALLTGATLSLTSCAEKEVTYKLDAKATTLNWTGKYIADGHAHTGTVNVTGGSMAFKGEELVSGDFTVDLTTLKSTDLSGAMADTLDAHLNGMYFFNTAKYANVDVKVNEISAKEIKATLTVMGKKIDAVMPVKMTKDEKSLKAKGKFVVDFAPAPVVGFKALEGEPENAHVDSKISFEINLVMKK